MTGSCFHCGESLSPAGAFHVDIEGERKPVCCAGCEAAVQMIQGAGLSDYYRFRDATSRRPDSGPDEWHAYDNVEAQREFVLSTKDGFREAALAVEGMRCSACAWLIERALGSIKGVVSVSVNPAISRLLLRWDSSVVELGTLLRQLSRLGYRPYPIETAVLEDHWTHERRDALKRVAVAGFGMMQVMMNAVAVYIGDWHGMESDYRIFLNAVSLLITTPVVFYSAQPFFSAALRSLRAGRAGMDIPVAAAVLIAYAASVWSVLTSAGTVYFDSVAMFVFFLLCGRYVEMQTRHYASVAGDALSRGLPGTAHCERGGATVLVTRRELVTGDIVQVSAGEVVPADGLLLSGDSRMDESLLTGESEPCRRRPGDAVVAGSINLAQPVRIRVTGTGVNTRLSIIARLLLRAQSERPTIASMADRIAGAFVLVVLLSAAAGFVFWWQVQPSMALAVTLSILVVSCPCALSLATPVALATTGSRMLRDGLLVIHSQAVETLAKVTDVVFDKTGTLTTGRTTLLDVECLGAESRDQCCGIADALERYSSHPLAHAFRSSATVAPVPSQVNVVAGQGIEGMVNGLRHRIGSAGFVSSLSGEHIPVDEGGIYLASEKGLLARFEIGDPPRPHVIDLVERLRREGVRVHIASGDALAIVARTAAQLGIGDFHARQTPEDKLALLRRLQEEGRTVMAVGDGINDAPVIAGADVSIALQGGSALAQAGADFVLAGESLAPIARGIDSARRCMRTIHQNLAWALAYNGLALPLAAMGWVPPWLAAIGMSASSLLVVANAARLMRRRQGTIGVSETSTMLVERTT